MRGVALFAAVVLVMLTARAASADEEIIRAATQRGLRVLYMAVNLACAAPDLVIAVGVAAGGPYRCAEIAGGAARCMRGERLDAAASAARCTAASTGKRIARASLWHGDADRVVSPANVSALATMLELMGVAVERRLVPGMGHAWSGGDPRGSHTYPPGPDASDAMLRFLVER